MKVNAWELYPYPGYEEHIRMMISTDEGDMVSMQKLHEILKAYTLGEGTTMEDIEIPGVEDGTMLKLRIIKPSNIEQPSPIVIDIHGGAFVSGNVDIDNYRNIYLAEHTPCIVVSVEYRLATRELYFPAQLLDCYRAYNWLIKNAGQIGGDPARIALHGTSAGGNLASGLALYLRDRGEQQPSLTVLNCPHLDEGMTASKLQYGMLGTEKRFAYTGAAIYLNANGNPYSYYGVPLDCPSLHGLGPHMIVVAEYDPLRDSGINFAVRLLQESVPCELIVAPRVTHGFCVMDKPLTRWIHRGICASFRREFGMSITEI